nr:ORF3 [Pseudomonas sp. BYT-1]QUQ62273.1 ORF3 [Hydrogenophaga sp. BYT-2]QUQ62280.1 ORF3 [Achromobacter sp. BYT-3]QUQ62287.1 ORF3 [Pseudomonas sp. BYT-4]
MRREIPAWLAKALALSLSNAPKPSRLSVRSLRWIRGVRTSDIRRAGRARIGLDRMEYRSGLLRVVAGQGPTNGSRTRGWPARAYPTVMERPGVNRAYERWARRARTIRSKSEAIAVARICRRVAHASVLRDRVLIRSSTRRRSAMGWARGSLPLGKKYWQADRCCSRWLTAARACRRGRRKTLGEERSDLIMTGHLRALISGKGSRADFGSSPRVWCMPAISASAVRRPGG